MQEKKGENAHVTFGDALLTTIIGGLFMAAGLVVVRRHWVARGGAPHWMLPAGWLAVVSAFVLFAQAWGVEMGTTYALGVVSLAAYGLVILARETRTAKAPAPREAAYDPETRPTNWRRGIAKSLLAIVLSGIASIGVGVAMAVTLPLPPQDRAVIGGLLVPILWGGGMAWTLCDPRLVRATIILLGVSALSYGIAFLPKVLA